MWDAAANVQGWSPHPCKPDLETPSERLETPSQSGLLDGSKLRQTGNVTALVTDCQRPCSGRQRVERMEERGTDSHGRRLAELSHFRLPLSSR